MPSKTQRDRFVERAVALGAAYLLAPETTSDPLTNLGSVALSPGELKNGAALSASGLVDGAAAAVLEGTNDYIDPLWPTRTNLCTNPYAGALATTGWNKQDTPTTFEATESLPTLAGLPAGITTAFHVVGDSGGDGASITFPQVEGAKYRMSLYAHIASKTATGLRFSYDGSGVIGVNFSTVGGGFTRIDFEHTGPAAAPTGNIRIRQNSAGAIDFYFTAVLIEESASLGSYGPLPADLTSGLAGWSDPTKPHNSASDWGPFARGTRRTFVAAVKPTDLADRAVFAGSAAVNVTQLILRSTPLVRYDTDTSKSPVEWSAPSGIVAGTTAFAALTYDDPSSLAQLFVNGAAQSSQAETDVFPTGQTLLIGARSIGGSLGLLFKGSLLPFAVFTRVLSAAEVKSLYRAATYEPLPPAVLREPPSDRLMVRVEPLEGEPNRLAADEALLENSASGIRLVDEMPGGEKEASWVTPRDPRSDWRDIEIYGEVVVKSDSGEVVWGEGQMDKVQETDGDRLEVAPAAVGYQAVLEDNRATKLGIIDRDLGRWGEIPTELRRKWEGETIDPDAVSSSVSPFGGGGEANQPAGITFTFNALKKAVTELGAKVYDSGGIDIAKVLYDFYGYKEANVDFLHQIALSYDGISATVPGTDHNVTTALQQALESSLDNLRYAIMVSGYTGALELDPFGPLVAGFHNICVLGAHGLTPQGEWPNIGFTAEQILRYAIPLHAPPLELGELEDDGFVIPHFWFPDATTMGTIVKEATKYGLLDWYVKGKEFNLRQPGAGTRRWQVYDGLRETGKDGQRLWESIVVQWQDVDGTTKTAGPLGSGANYEDEGLRITDPEHPAVKSPRVRRDLLVLKGVGVAREAIRAGERWLEDANVLDRSGDCTLYNYVMDEAGNLFPVSYVRAWDLIRFPLKRDKSYRRISRRDYDDDAKAVNLSIDAPPEGMEALLERYNAALVPYGL